MKTLLAIAAIGSEFPFNFVQAQLPAQTLLDRVNEAPALLDNSVHRRADGVPGLSPERFLRNRGSGPFESGNGSLGETEVTWFPDGMRLLAKMPYRRDGKIASAIFLADLESGIQTYLSDGRLPRLSADGRRLAFLDTRGGLWLGRVVGGHHAPSLAEDVVIVSKNGEVVSDSAWSPNSQEIAYFRRIDTRVTNEGWETQRETQLVVYNVRNGEERIAYRTAEDLVGLCWAARRIIFARRKIGEPPGAGAPRDYWGEIDRLDPGTHRIERMVDKIGYGTHIRPSISPDAKELALGYEPFQVPPVAAYMEPAVYNLSSHEMRVFQLDKNFALTAEGPRWGKSSERVVYRCKTGGLFSSVCIIDAASGSMDRIDLDPLREISALSISPVDGRIALISEDTLGDIRLTVVSGDLKRRSDIYSLQRYDLDGVALGKVQTIRWSTPDGLEFGGLLVLPVDYAPGTRYPLIVDIHGGPDGGIGLSGSLSLNSLEWQVWAAKGYAVLVADYRKSGTAGLKEAYVRRLKGFLEDGDVTDILAGIDEIVHLGIADSDRVGAVGHSYGGVVLDWLVIQSHRLKAAIVHEGFPAWWDGASGTWAHSGVWLAFRRWLMGTDEANRARVEAENEPLSYANRISTPLLWISGGTANLVGNINVPRLYVNSINANGGTARLVFFPNEGHVFRDEEDIREELGSAIGWFDHWLKGGVNE